MSKIEQILPLSEYNNKPRWRYEIHSKKQWFPGKVILLQGQVSSLLSETSFHLRNQSILNYSPSPDSCNTQKPHKSATKISSSTPLYCSSGRLQNDGQNGIFWYTEGDY